MKLARNVFLVFEGKRISDDTLEYYRNRWKGKALLPGVGNEAKGEIALQALLYESVPFTITGEPGDDPLTFEVSFKIFPYAIDGKKNFASYGIRLIPRQGKVKSVDLEEQHTVAVNTLSSSPNSVIADTGNGNLHLEIFYTPTTEKLEEIAPPAHFREEVFLDHSSFVD